MPLRLFGHCHIMFITLNFRCRLVEPFTNVEVAHIAMLIELPVAAVEGKLSQMVLDKQFAGENAGSRPFPLCGIHRACRNCGACMPCSHLSAGTLDQGCGTLKVYEEPPPAAIAHTTLKTFDSMNRVVEALATRTLPVAGA